MEAEWRGRVEEVNKQVIRGRVKNQYKYHKFSFLSEQDYEGGSRVEQK